MTATNDQISYAEFTLTVPANSSIPIERQSDFVACLSSTADFKIRLNNSPSAFFTAGLTVEPIGGLESVQVVNDTATALTVTLAFGRGNIRDSRVTLNANQILPTRESAPDVLQTNSTKGIGSGAAVVISAASALKREVIVKLLSNASDNIFVGDASVTNTKGIPIEPGAAVVLKTQATVYAIAGSGTQYAWTIENRWSS